MNYSDFYPSILINYFIAFIGIVGVIILLILGGIYLIKEYIKLKSVIELIGIVICVIAITGIAYFSRNFFKDIPNVVGKNYVITTGTAHGWDKAGQVHETRGFDFKPDNGEIINITVTYTPVYKGDRFEVMYLPNTGFGVIIQKLEDDKIP